MNDSFGMSGVERVDDFNRQIEQNGALDGLSGDTMLKRQPVQKFHGDKAFAVVLTDFINGADVGMVEGRRRPGLAAETFQSLRVLCHFVGKEFECDKATE